MTSPSGARLGPDPEVPLGKFTEQEIGEVHRPHPVATLLQPEVLVLKRSAQEYLTTPEANRPRGAHQPHQMMARVLGRRQRLRILARRRVPSASRGLLAQRLVRPLVIIGVAKRLELVLLPHPVGSR